MTASLSVLKTLCSAIITSLRVLKVKSSVVRFGLG